MRVLPISYSLLVIAVGVLLQVLLGGTRGIILIGGGTGGALAKLRLRQLEQRGDDLAGVPATEGRAAHQQTGEPMPDERPET
jgi:hypothetical protein